jgi:hypothetical protein
MAEGSKKKNEKEKDRTTSWQSSSPEDEQPHRRELIENIIHHWELQGNPSMSFLNLCGIPETSSFGLCRSYKPLAT